MYRVEQSVALADKVHELWVRAPHVARHAEPGQFLIVRIDEAGERIPLTISAVRDESVRLIFMTVGKTTTALADLRAGDSIEDVAGPLGRPSEVKTYGTCVIVGGGVGIAGTPILARALKQAGNYVIGIIGARSAPFLILEDEMRDACDELHVTTDDGTKGEKGFAAELLKRIIAERTVDRAWVIGPAIMMKVTSAVTKPAGIRTYVSLNPIMVDGTGMCGSCRVTVAGETKFACVDGPEFDAHQVDFDALMQRLRTYSSEEKDALEIYHAHGCGCRGKGSR